MAAPRKTKPCDVPLTRDRYDEPDYDGPRCLYLRAPGHVKCRWHRLLAQPIHAQVTAARYRLTTHKQQSMPDRARVPADQRPDGERWCAGCQSFVPLFYVQGSRCRACNSAASHASHLRRTYDLDSEEYERLLEWQNGRCYICQQLPRKRRLAVDHDHRTGHVRGLLCANDEYGCNVLLARLLNDIEVARRALAYVELGSIHRMRNGEPPVRPPVHQDPSWDLPPVAPPVPLEQWDPFAA